MLDWAVLKVIGVCGIVIAVCAVIAAFAKKWLLRYHAVLSKEMKKNLTRKAVKRMNRRVYRILRMRYPKYWLAWKMTDNVYEQALKEHFTDVSLEDWSRYMEIVKKNHYSKEEISAEEMQDVYKCYKEVRLFNISLTKLWENKN